MQFGCNTHWFVHIACLVVLTLSCLIQNCLSDGHPYSFSSILAKRISLECESLLFKTTRNFGSERSTFISLTRSREFIVDFSKMPPIKQWPRELRTPEVLAQQLLERKLSSLSNGMVGFTLIDFVPGSTFSLLLAKYFKKATTFRIVSNPMALLNVQDIVNTLSPSLQSLTLAIDWFQEPSQPTLNFSRFQGLKQLRFLHASIEQRFKIEFSPTEFENSLQFVAFSGDTIKQELNKFFLPNAINSDFNLLNEVDHILFVSGAFNYHLFFNARYPYRMFSGDAYIESTCSNDKFLFIDGLDFMVEENCLDIDIPRLLTHLAKAGDYSYCLFQGRHFLHYSLDLVHIPVIEHYITHIGFHQDLRSMICRRVIDTVTSRADYRIILKSTVLEYLTVPLMVFVGILNHTSNDLTNLKYLRLTMADSRKYLNEVIRNRNRFPNLKMFFIVDGPGLEIEINDRCMQFFLSLEKLGLGKISFNQLAGILFHKGSCSLSFLSVDFAENTILDSIWFKSRSPRLINLKELEIKACMPSDQLFWFLLKMPNLERLVLEIDCIDNIDEILKLSIPTLILRCSQLNSTLVEFYFDPKRKPISITSIEDIFSESQLTVDDWKYFYFSIVKGSLTIPNIHRNCLPFLLLRRDPQLQALVQSRDRNIQQYLNSKLALGAEPMCNESYLLLWSISFEKLSQLIPTAQVALNWRLFHKIYSFSTQSGLVFETIHEHPQFYNVLFHDFLTAVDNLLLSESLQGQQELIRDDFDSDQFFTSMFKNLLRERYPYENVCIKPFVNFDFPIKDYLPMTDNDTISLMINFLGIFLDIHKACKRSSQFVLQDYFTAFQNIFGPRFDRIVQSLQADVASDSKEAFDETDSLSESEKAFIDDFFKTLIIVRGDYPELSAPNQIFNSSPYIQIQRYKITNTTSLLQLMRMTLRLRLQLLNDNCAICMMELKTENFVMLFPQDSYQYCHVLHWQCWEDARKHNNKCPHCRQKLWSEPSDAIRRNCRPHGTTESG